MPKTLKTKSGFTIIEVVLVLAIAGLIFMAVFIALPALQKSQRDTQRQSDIEKVVSKIGNYQASNRQRLPGEDDSGTRSETTVTGTDKYAKQTNTKSWDYFYHEYILTAENDRFNDPQSSNPYNLQILVDKDAPAGGNYEKDTIYVSVGQGKGYTCDGENVVESKDNKRKVAVHIKSEARGIICESN